MENVKKTYQLTNENINEIVSKIDVLKKENIVEKDMMLKVCLAYEEILLNLQKHFSKDKSINFEVKKQKNKINIIMSYIGENYNPCYADEEDIELVEMNNKMLESLGVGINYSNEKNVNYLITTLNYKKMSLTKRLLIGALIGIVIGLCGSLIPIDIKEEIKIIINPITSIILGFIKMMAFPIIFLSIITGITGCGSVSTFGKMGKVTIITFFKVMIFTEILTTILFLIIFKVDIFQVSHTNNILVMFIDAIQEMFPNNIVKSFYNESCVQIVFVGIFIGCALLVLEKKVSDITKICEQLNDIFKLILNWFSSLIPILVSLLLVKFLWDGESLLACVGVWKAILVEFVVLTILLIIQIVIIKVKTKISYKDIFRAFVPAMIKGFTTGSTYCAYQDIVENSKNILKVESAHADFYSAMGVSFYKVSNVMYSCIVMYFAFLSEKETSIIELIVSGIIFILFSISAPSVAGGGVAILTLLFEILIGVNSPYLGVATSVVVILDFFTTAIRSGSMVLINKNIDIKISNIGDGG